MSFGFYLDSNLTVPATLTSPINIVINTAGGGYVDIPIWFGSPDETKKAQAASDPGVDNITITVTDINTSIHNADETTGPYWVLALNSSDLDTNPRNNTIEIGTEVLGGTENAVQFYLRIFEPEQPPNVYEDWILTTNALLISNV